MGFTQDLRQVAGAKKVIEGGVVTETAVLREAEPTPAPLPDMVAASAGSTTPAATNGSVPDFLANQP